MLPQFFLFFFKLFKNAFVFKTSRQRFSRPIAFFESLIETSSIFFLNLQDKQKQMQISNRLEKKFLSLPSKTFQSTLFNQRLCSRVPRFVFFNDSLLMRLAEKSVVLQGNG